LDAAQEPRKAPEFRHFRLALLVVVGAPVGLLAVLIATSIVLDLFAYRPLTPARDLRPEDLLACNRAVRDLLDGLVDEVASIERATLTSQTRDIGGEWDAFATRWQSTWESASARCGFGELEGTGKGAGYDRMAWVHRNLPTTRLKLRELVSHFSRDVGVDVTEMRDALDKSRADLASAGQGKEHE
jgi:hypothetical protein